MTRRKQARREVAQTDRGRMSRRRRSGERLSRGRDVARGMRRLRAALARVPVVHDLPEPGPNVVFVRPPRDRDGVAAGAGGVVAGPVPGAAPGLIREVAP